MWLFYMRGFSGSIAPVDAQVWNIKQHAPKFCHFDKSILGQAGSSAFDESLQLADPNKCSIMGNTKLQERRPQFPLTVQRYVLDHQASCQLSGLLMLQMSRFKKLWSCNIFSLFYLQQINVIESRSNKIREMMRWSVDDLDKVIVYFNHR
jgi:hypothetical protein